MSAMRFKFGKFALVRLSRLLYSPLPASRRIEHTPVPDGGILRYTMDNVYHVLRYFMRESLLLCTHTVCIDGYVTRTEAPVPFDAACRAGVAWIVETANGGTDDA